MQNNVSFCHKIPPKGENNFRKKVAFCEFKKIGHNEHIQSPPTLCRKILFGPLKILQNEGKAGENTPSQNLEVTISS
jgi:hypothetical protein